MRAACLLPIALVWWMTAAAGGQVGSSDQQCMLHGRHAPAGQHGVVLGAAWVCLPQQQHFSVSVSA